MDPSRMVLLGLLALALVGVGCMDPSIYEGYGRSAPPPSAPAAPAAATPAPPRPPAQPPALSDNVAIVIEKIETDTRAASGAAVGFVYADDAVAVASPGGKLARRNGIRIGVAGERFQAQLEASLRRSRSTRRQKLFITVLSGHEGTILVGADTYVGRLGYWTREGYRVVAERAFLGRSLAVRPRILSNGLIEVELWPRFTARGRRGAIDLTELATKVVVRDGQPMVLGGLNTSGDEVGAVLFGVGRETRTGTMTLILTPKIGGMPIDWPKGEW